MIFGVRLSALVALGSGFRGYMLMGLGRVGCRDHEGSCERNVQTNDTTVLGSMWHIEHV